MAAVDIRDDSLQETVALSPGEPDRLSTHVVDITNRSEVGMLPDDVTIERVMNVNFWGLLNMTKTFLPHLLERPEAHIVNISSMGGFLPVPGQTAYGASKAAVKLLTEGLLRAGGHEREGHRPRSHRQGRQDDGPHLPPGA